jgi:hypothetical protein
MSTYKISITGRVKLFPILEILDDDAINELKSTPRNSKDEDTDEDTDILRQQMTIDTHHELLALNTGFYTVDKADYVKLPHIKNIITKGLYKKYLLVYVSDGEKIELQSFFNYKILKKWLTCISDDEDDTYYSDICINVVESSENEFTLSLNNKNADYIEKFAWALFGTNI